MWWNEYVMNDHCPEYENLTMEEKLLVDIEVRKWFKDTEDLCIPMFIFRLTESRIIEELKRKEKNDRRNRKQSASRRNNK